MHEVKISKHWQDNKFNVDLVSWQGNQGIVFGRAFGVSKKEAIKEANKQAELYNAPITED